MGRPRRHIAGWRVSEWSLAAYNDAVSRPTSSGRRPGGRLPGGAPAPHKRLETLGLIVIVILILSLVITRSWHLIAWRAR
jgi:hypothetical protein